MKTLLSAIWSSVSGRALGSESRVKVAVSAVKIFVDRGILPRMTGREMESNGKGRLAKGRVPACILLMRANQSMVVRGLWDEAMGCMGAMGGWVGGVSSTGEIIGICMSLDCARDSMVGTG